MRKHNYVVGFTGDGQVAYGKEIKKEDNNIYNNATYVELLTYKEAQKAVKKLIKPNYCRGKRFVYKLEEVYTID